MLNTIGKIIYNTKFMLYYHGLKNYEKGNLNTAKEYIRKSLHVKPNYAPAIDILICIGVLENDNKTIEEAIQLVLEKGKISQHNLLNLVKGFYHLEQYDNAIEYMNRVKKHSYQKDIKKYKGKILLKKGDYEKAYDILKEINSIENEKNPYTLIDLAASLVKIGKIEEGINTYNKAEAIGDENIKRYLKELTIEVDEDYLQKNSSLKDQS